MSSAPELLSFCAASGVELWEENGLLRYHGAAEVVAPILPDLQRFKPALLELLTAPETSTPTSPGPTAPEASTAPQFRRANQWVFVPATIETAPGAAKICAVLQSFRRLFEAARGGDLPTEPLGVEFGGEPDTFENPASVVAEIESHWSDVARECGREKRDLTPEETELPDGAAEIFNHVWACYDGPGESWLDLAELNRQLDADLKAMRDRQCAAQSEAAL